MNLSIKAFFLLALIGLSSCTSTKKSVDCNNSYDHNYKGSVKVGDPYSIKAKTYVPTIDQHYDQVGTASWYGDYFHCRKTANGEVFNKHQFSGAHNTLPLPSVVRVTHLENGKSVKLIVNDRGPFAKNRIIDISERAAKEIGMKEKGVATVRVEFLPEETNKLMVKIAAPKKIYYDHKSLKNVKSKYELAVAQYSNQNHALVTMRKLAKFAKANLLASKNMFKVMIHAKNMQQAQNLQKKLIKMGYKNAKIISH